MLVLSGRVGSFSGGVVSFLLSAPPTLREHQLGSVGEDISFGEGTIAPAEDVHNGSSSQKPLWKMSTTSRLPLENTRDLQMAMAECRAKATPRLPGAPT